LKLENKFKSCARHELRELIMRKILFFIIAAVIFCSCGKNARRKTQGTGVEQKDTTVQELSIPLPTPKRMFFVIPFKF